MNAKITYIDNSPCILKCSLNSERVCTGCFRSMDEITAWSKADTDAKLKIIDNSLKRKEAY